MATTDTPVRLELRLPGSRASFYEVQSAEFLIGSVPGCDLVVPDPNLPPVVGVIARTAEGPRLRKLAPNLKLLLNGKPVHHAALNHGDSIAVGPAELRVHMSVAAPVAVPVAAGAAPPNKPWSFKIPLGGSDDKLPADIDPSGALRQMRQEADRLKQHARELESKRRSLDNEEEKRRQAWAEREAQLEAEVVAAQERRQRVEQAARPPAAVHDVRASDLAAREAALDSSIRQHREDLVRLDRHRAELADIERDHNTRLAEMEARDQQLRREAQLADDRARQIEQAEAQLAQDRERVRAALAEAEAARQQAQVQVADAQRRDAQLNTLEQRCDRVREELSREAQALAEQKKVQDALVLELAGRDRQCNARITAAETLEKRVADQQASVQEVAGRLQSLQQELGARQAELAALDSAVRLREEQVTHGRSALEKAVQSHREDLARLDRFREALETREKDVTRRLAECEQRDAALRTESEALKEQARQQTDQQAKLKDEETRLTQLQAEYEAGSAQLLESSAMSEGQQKVIATLKTKMERMREELRREAQSLAEQRSRQEGLDRELAEKQKQLDDLRAAVEAAAAARDTERQQLDEQREALAVANTELKSVLEQVEAQKQELDSQKASFQTEAGEQTQTAATLRTKAAQLLELHQRIETDKLTLQEREQTLAKAEEARRELQEQLLRRGEELDARMAAVQEQAAELARRAVELDVRAAEVERDRERVDADLSHSRQDLDTQAAEVQQVLESLAEREADLGRKAEKLKEIGLAMAADRKAHLDAKSRLDDEHRVAAEDLVRTRAELETYRHEVLARASEIQEALPNLEVRGQSALERLSHAREQLKSHVAELHDYARQSHADLETVRTQVQAETDRLREQQSSLVKARSDHRLAVTAFRQQLIDWQGRVAEMKQALSQDGTRLERKQLELDDTADKLAKQAAALHVQEQQVAQKREEVEYHLEDMRDWFRRKFRELADSSVFNRPWYTDGAETNPEDTAVLPFTQDLDPGDKKLGELLQSLDLVDDATLSALLLEARRQHRTLRQVLLASGKLTVYQMALIETGNVDGLTIGPLGVIDRLRVTPHENVYRAIDPRAGATTGPVLLRHLSETDTSDADRAQEFRDRFAALAELRHPHVLATIEVMEINGRPAALQEWVSGLPGTDWPSLAASPGVWYRLTCQALLGLSTAHQAGLTHGGLTGRSVVLTHDGLVKIVGVGEPAWLSGATPAASVGDDLISLGRVAAGWSALTPKRKGAKPPRPLPDSVREVLDQWIAGRYDSAHAILEALDAAGSDVPSGAETWERLVRFAGENAAEGVTWRKSA